jgi:hypothetical protein
MPYMASGFRFPTQCTPLQGNLILIVIREIIHYRHHHASSVAALDIILSILCSCSDHYDSRGWVGTAQPPQFLVVAHFHYSSAGDTIVEVITTDPVALTRGTTTMYVVH